MSQCVSLCAHAMQWVEVGLAVLILSLSLFLCLLRFWDDSTDKQQAMDTGYRPTDKYQLLMHHKLVIFPKSRFIRFIRTTDGAAGLISLVIIMICS